MKVRKLIISVVSAICLATCCLGVAFTAQNYEKAKADAASNAYWNTIFEVESDGTVDFTSNQTRPSYTGDVNPAGLGIEFNKTTKLTYKVPVLLGKMTDLLTFYVNPTQQSANTDSTKSTSADREFGTVDVFLTDVNDPSIYVQIRFQASTYSAQLSWVQAASNTQTLCAIKKKSMELSADKGGPVQSTFNGLGNAPFNCKYDYDTKVVHTTNLLYASDDGTVVRDLDDKKMLASGDVIFDGFTSRLVNMSIVLSSVYDEEVGAHVILTQIAGQSLKGEKIIDNTKPALDIADKYVGREMPNGQVGVPYPFMDFVAFDTVDGDLNKNLKADIYYDYDGVREQCVVGNRNFVPTKKGSYTAIYSVADASGNVADPVRIDFTVVPKLEKISMVIDGDYPTSTKIGNILPIYGCETRGGSGVIDVKVQAFLNGKEIAVENTLNIEEQGYYTIRYTATDYLNCSATTVVKEYSISAELSSTPIVDTPSLPMAALQGKTILVEKPKAYDYVSFGRQEEVPVKIFVQECVDASEYVDETDANNFTKFVEFEGGKFAPKKTTKLVYVKYYAKAAIGLEYYLSEAKVVKIYNPEVGLGEYFYTESVSKTYDIDANGVVDESGFEGVDLGIRYMDISGETATAKGKRIADSSLQAYYNVLQNGVKMQFVNPLSAQGFTFSMNFLKKYANFKKITVNLTDVVNGKQSITFVIENNDDKTSFIEFNGYTYSLTGSIYKPEANSTVTLSIKLGNVIYDSLGKVGVVTTADDGSVFTGFDSDMVYCTITFDEVELRDELGLKKEAMVRFNNINNQATITRGLTDRIVAQTLLLGDIPIYNDYGTTIELPAAKAADVINPDATVSISVTAPDGTVLYKNEDISKPILLPLEQFGQYMVVYNADDGRDINPLQRSVYSADSVAPTIQIDGQIARKAKVGDTITIPKSVAIDNLTENMPMFVYVITPNSYFTNMTNTGAESTYTFKEVGIYTVRFFCQDQYFNFAEKNFTVVVTD